jgi:hypothetical protein
MENALEKKSPQTLRKFESALRLKISPLTREVNFSSSAQETDKFFARHSIRAVYGEGTKSI